MDPKDLEDKNAISQRKKQQITILVKDYFKKWSRNRRLKITKDNKPKVNLKHPAHHILLQIVYVDDLYNIYKILKVKQQ